MFAVVLGFSSLFCKIVSYMHYRLEILLHFAIVLNIFGIDSYVNLKYLGKNGNAFCFNSSKYS